MSEKESRILEALTHLRAARRLLQSIPAPMTSERVRLAITSCQGARRYQAFLDAKGRRRLPHFKKSWRVPHPDRPFSYLEAAQRSKQAFDEQKAEQEYAAENDSKRAKGQGGEYYQGGYDPDE